MNEFEKVQYQACKARLAKVQRESIQDKKEFKSMLSKLKERKENVTDTIFRRCIVVEPDGTEFLVIREVTTGRNGKSESKILSKQKISERIVEQERKEEVIVEKLKSLNNNAESLINIMAKQGISRYKVAKRRKKIATLSLEHF